MTPPGWDPRQYEKFFEHRSRPAQDLFARVELDTPSLVYDIGCGRGEIARMAADRWPEARVVGLDASAEMLAAAAAEPSRVDWVRQDITSWMPTDSPDLIYANAVLHWVDHHDEVLQRLFAALVPRGVLAIQMPLSWREPSHSLMRRILADELLGTAELRARLARRPVALPEWYHDHLSGSAAEVDIWTTTYYQTLRGNDPVLEWMKGTGLRPVLEALEGTELERFVRAYRKALREAYPRSEDGTTIFPFPRLFVVARAPS